MAIGYPDWLTPRGSAAAGQDVLTQHTSALITANSETAVVMATVPADEEWIVQGVLASCSDDTTIHKAELKIHSTTSILAEFDFVMAREVFFPGIVVDADGFVDFIITNNNDSDLTFHLTLYYVRRLIA